MRIKHFLDKKRFRSQRLGKVSIMPCYNVNSNSDQDEVGIIQKKSVDEDGEGRGNTPNVRRLASGFLKLVDSRGKKQTTAKHLTRVKNNFFEKPLPKHRHEGPSNHKSQTQQLQLQHGQKRNSYRFESSTLMGDSSKRVSCIFFHEFLFL